MHELHLEFKELPYAVEENLNRLRINLRFCGQNTKKILVTSTIPGEGKSSMAIWIWKMLAEAGFKTAFVDMDMRKSENAKRYIRRTTSRRDIGYYLSGQAELEEIVYKTNIPNGLFVPCFTCLESPSNLLEDSRLGDLLDTLATECRYVIIDSPPLGSVADAALIAASCDGALMVVHAGQVSKRLIKESMQQLEKADCNLIGVVLNQVKTSEGAYRKYYKGAYKNYEYYSSKEKKK